MVAMDSSESGLADSGGAEGGGAVWPISGPASQRKATTSGKMRDFMGTLCSKLFSVL
jgi:hypothetical protein